MAENIKRKHNANKFLDCLNKYIMSKENKEFGRYKSWEHCYEAFYKARDNQKTNYYNLALHLAFYLASWGMYRGSSFLLQKDFTIHIDAIKVLFNNEYKDLWEIEYKDYNEERLSKLDKLKKKLEDSYNKFNYNKRITDTLSSKILLGTLGCVPAYDRYFKLGLKAYGFQQRFCKKSIRDICEFYDWNKREIEKMRNKLKINNEIMYPQMKLIDMGFWMVGQGNNK